MTEPQGQEVPLPPVPERELLKFQLPEIEDVEVYLIRLEDGRIVARTKEELEAEGG